MKSLQQKILSVFGQKNQPKRKWLSQHEIDQLNQIAAEAKVQAEAEKRLEMIFEGIEIESHNGY